jgi:MFS family permease
VQASRRTIRSLQLTAAALSSGYGVMFAVLAKIRDAYGISETMLGVIVGAGFFASFAAQIVLAPLADRGHARLLLLGGLTANIGGLLIVATSSTSFGFVSGRTLMGLGIGAAYPALRRSIAVVDPDNVGKNLGGMLSADVVGFLMGPAIAALLVGHIGIRWPFVVAAALSAVFLPVTWSTPFGAPDPKAHEQPRLALGLLRYPWMQSASAYGVAFFIMIGIFDALWAVRIDDLRGRYLYVTLGIIVFAAPMVVLAERGGVWVEKRGPFRIGGLGLCVGAVCLSLYGLIPVPWMLILVGAVHASSDAYTASSVPVGVSLAAPPAQLAGAQGLVGAVQTLTGGVAAMSAGAAYDRFGPVVTYMGGSGVMFIAIAFGWIRAGELRNLRKSTISASDIVAAPAQTPAPA